MRKLHVARLLFLRLKRWTKALILAMTAPHKIIYNNSMVLPLLTQTLQILRHCRKQGVTTL